MEAVGKFFCGLLLTIVGILLGGFIISTFWGWFIQPTFPTLPLLTVGQGIGLSVFISFLLRGLARTSDIKETGFWVQMVTHIVGLLVSLLFGWIVHLFM